MLWDESNMLKAIRIADQSLQHYIYDAHGERTLKGKGNVTVVSVNGVPQSTTATIGNYTIYESGYIVVGPNGYVTKHYYNGSERVSSRLGGSVSGYLSGAAVGGAETATLPSRQQADLTYVFGQFGLGTVTVTNQPPAPGDCEVAGNCASNLYYFHPDHVGSSTFLSDQNGQPYQFLLYLPFGESMASQKAGGWATPYKFNGKELDDETGMYYYGARYYDPRLSMWHGVDPLAEMYPDWSPFAYTMNNPITYADPTGMSTEEGGGGGDDPPSIFSGIEKAWKDFKNKVFGEDDDTPSAAEFLDVTLDKIKKWSEFYSEIGENIIDEVPMAGEINSVSDGDYVEAAVGLIPFGKKLKKVIEKASDLPVIKKGTKEWDDVVEKLRNNSKMKINVRVESASDASDLLNESRGNMNRYKQYSKDKGVKYDKGYEVHNQQNVREIDAGNDLQHIKWKDNKAGGHIYYNKPN